MELKSFLTFSAAAVMLFLAAPAWAAPFVLGDVFASVGGGAVRQFKIATGAVEQTIATSSCTRGEPRRTHEGK